VMLCRTQQQRDAPTFALLLDSWVLL
jgi:hypothetical protein